MSFWDDFMEAGENPEAQKRVERHMSTWAIIRLGSPIRRLIFWWKLRDARKRERVAVLARERARLSAMVEYERAVDAGQIHHAAIADLAIFVIALDSDLMTIFHAHAKEGIEWNARFFLRQAVVQLYEAAEDIPELTGRKFKAILREIPFQTDVFKELKQIRSGYARFYRENRAALKTIRNAVGAHRDHRAFDAVQLMESIKPTEVFDLIVALSVLNQQLLGFLTRVMTAMSHPRIALILAARAIDAKTVKEKKESARHAPEAKKVKKAARKSHKAKRKAKKGYRT